MVRRRRKNKVGSVRTFLDILEKLNPTTDEVLYFRGHSNSTHLLTPSIYRFPNWIKNEDILYKEMILRCPNDFREQENTFQMLVKMQHYSLPTRLFDITANPLIGLYFACLKGKKRTGTDGEVVVFKIPKRDVRYFDSDTVSVISNISRRPHTFTVPPAADIEEFNKTEEIGFLLHEIKKEKPYFEPKIKREHIWRL
jgi:hypothetical protein